MEASIRSELKHTFNPEFLNRVDEIVVFHSLTQDHLKDIIDILIADLNRQLLEQGIQLDVDDKAREWILKEGYQPSYGARPLRRAIQKHLEDPLSEEIIKGRFKEGGHLRATVQEGGIHFTEAGLPALTSA